MSLTIYLKNRDFFAIPDDNLEVITMMIKTILLSFTTAILAVGCVAFPDDGPYNNTGYNSTRHYNGGYDQRYNTRYNQNNERARWERERAYRVQQARIEQQRKQQINRQHWQLDQNRKRAELERQRRNHANNQQRAPNWRQAPKDQGRWNRNEHRKVENQNKRISNSHRDQKRDHRRNDRDKD